MAKYVILLHFYVSLLQKYKKYKNTRSERKGDRVRGAMIRYVAEQWRRDCDCVGPGFRASRRDTLSDSDGSIRATRSGLEDHVDGVGFAHVKARVQGGPHATTTSWEGLGVVWPQEAAQFTWASLPRGPNAQMHDLPHYITTPMQQCMFMFYACSWHLIDHEILIIHLINKQYKTC